MLLVVVAGGVGRVKGALIVVLLVVGVVVLVLRVVMVEISFVLLQTEDAPLCFC